MLRDEIPKLSAHDIDIRIFDEAAYPFKLFLGEIIVARRERIIEIHWYRNRMLGLLLSVTRANVAAADSGRFDVINACPCQGPSPAPTPGRRKQD
jgi:hypothetical protein